METIDPKYEDFKKNLNRLINVDLNLYKEKQMKRRISSLLSRNGYKGFDDYFEALKKDSELLDQFINYMTINVSEFYRNLAQWNVLKDTIIPALKAERNGPLKIWSAACSTGEEPYSLVMLLSQFYNLREINVFASDLDEGAMKKAKEGIYTVKSTTNLPIDLKNKYFTKEGSMLKISNDIKSRVEFKKMDLLKDSYPKGFDLICCRNVMIYFTDEAKEEMYRKFNQSLMPYGVFFVGSTEQIISPDKFNFKSSKTFFYEKIEKK